jgi:RNA polymerase sigma-70 factor (ECF subfamily)
MEPKNEIKLFTQLYTEYRARFIRFAYAYVKDRAVAEDAASEAFVYYWEHRHTLPPDANLPGYLLTIVKHRCLNHLEHLRIRETVTEALHDHARWELNTRIATLEACEPDELFGAEIREIVERTLASLPAQTRLIFVMSRYENLTCREIAERCNMSVRGVEFHLAKAVKLLSRRLKDYLPICLWLLG